MSRLAEKKQPTSPAEVITRRRIAISLRRGYANLLKRIVIIAVIGWFVLTQVFLISQANGNGMFPAVKDGDLVIAFRLQREYVKDDVVVYETNGQRRIGHIVARESDVVTMNDSGALIVNGTTQGGEILYPSYAKEGITYPYVVPKGHVFLMGDFRTQTEDSRDHGSVPMENVEAKVITILRRRGI